MDVIFVHFIGVPPPLLVDKSHVQECLLEMLTDMFGSEGISKMIRNNMVTVTVDEKIATVNVDSLVSHKYKVHVIFNSPW